MDKKLFLGWVVLFFCGLLTAEPVRAVLFPFREAVISSRVESVLRPYPFKLGEAFSEKKVIALLEDDTHALKLKQAKEKLDFAKVVYLNKKELREKNFTSDFELQKALFEYQQAQNEHAAAKLNISYCRMTAPFAGKIVEFMTNEYETVRPGQPLMRIIDDNSLLAVMNVPLKNMRQIGSKVALRLDNGLKISGKVYEILPKADHRSATVRIRVLIDNSAGRLRAGMTGVMTDGQ